MKRWLKAVKILAAAGFVSGAALLGLLRVEHGSPIELPAPSGPLRVGRTSMVWAIQERPDGRPSRELADQRVVWIWYPAASTPGSKPSEYSSGSVARGGGPVPGPADRRSAHSRPGPVPGAITSASATIPC